MPYKYIGRTTDFKGKSLWEVLGNLKNFGVRRIVARSRFQRYPEPCYMKIRKVEGLPKVAKPSYDEKRKVIALSERVFRGIKQDSLVQVESATYKSDYFLVHKYEEEQFCRSTNVCIKRILPSKMEFPPLLKEFTVRQMKSNGTYTGEEPKMKICYNKTGIKTYQVAKEGETPTESEPSIGLGNPRTPRLYINMIE